MRKKRSLAQTISSWNAVEKDEDLISNQQQDHSQTYEILTSPVKTSTLCPLQEQCYQNTWGCEVWCNIVLTNLSEIICFNTLRILPGVKTAIYTATCRSELALQTCWGTCFNDLLLTPSACSLVPVPLWSTFGFQPQYILYSHSTRSKDQRNRVSECKSPWQKISGWEKWGRGKQATGSMTGNCNGDQKRK